MSNLQGPALAGTKRGVRRFAGMAVFAGAVALAPQAHATNGFFANGYGAPAKAQAGAGIAVGEGPLAPAQNPALGVDIGNVAGLCFTGFMPKRSVTVKPGGALVTGKHESENEFFPIVCGGVNTMVNDNQSSLGLLAFGNGGMNTEYNQNIFSALGGTSPLGVDMAQLFIAVNLAHKVTDKFRVGVAPVLAMQQFKAYGLEPFRDVSTSRDNVTGKGYDRSYGGGLKLGFNWDALSWLTVGATYQSRMYMTKYDKYSGLFAEQGDFDIPAFVGAGIAVKPNDRWTVQLEHQRIFYGDVAAISNSGAGPLGGMNLGADNGAGFGWKDMDIFRIGVQWQATDDLTLRTGFSHATDFTKNQEVLFNVLAPATVKDHVALGMTYRLSDRWSVTGSYAHAFSESLIGRNQNFTQDVKLEMSQDEIAVGFSYRF